MADTATERKLDRDQFTAMRNQLELLGRLVLRVDPDDLDAFIRQCSAADTLAPFVDPTAWMSGAGERLRVMGRHARALAAFRRSLDEP